MTKALAARIAHFLLSILQFGFCSFANSDVADWPGGSCISSEFAARIGRAFDLLEGRTMLALSRILQTRITSGHFVPRHVALYGGRPRTSYPVHASSADEACTGALDNRLRTPRRFNKTLLMRYAIPDFIQFLVRAELATSEVDTAACEEYLGEASVRLHVGYNAPNRQWVESHISLTSLATFVESLHEHRNRNLNPNRISSGRSVMLADRIRRVDPTYNSTLRHTLRLPDWMKAYQEVIRCWRITVTKDMIDTYMDDLTKRAKPGAFEQVSRGTVRSRPNRVCGSSDERALFLVPTPTERPLERVAYELGYSTTYESSIDSDLTEIAVLEDECNLIPTYLARDAMRPFRAYLWSSLNCWMRGLMAGEPEARVGICGFTPTERLGHTSTTIPLPRSTPTASRFACSWVVFQRE